MVRVLASVAEALRVLRAILCSIFTLIFIISDIIFLLLDQYLGQMQTLDLEIGDEFLRVFMFIQNYFGHRPCRLLIVLRYVYDG